MTEKETKKMNTSKTNNEEGKPTPVPLVDTYTLKKEKEQAK